MEITLLNILHSVGNIYKHTLLNSNNYDIYLSADLLQGYQKLCDAAQKVSPALLDLEEKHLGRFALTWEDFNKHLYQSVIYTDPLIQNNLPIFISQVT